MFSVCFNIKYCFTLLAYLMLYCSFKKSWLKTASGNKAPPALGRPCQSYWTIYRSFEIILEWELSIDWNSNPMLYANPLLLFETTD